MPERRHPRRTVSAAAAALLPVLLLAGCGEDEVGTKPTLPSETPALWNPCDALGARFVDAQFGASTEEHNGTPTSPECRFAPPEGSGDPALTVNYQLFSGDLDQFWDAMGQPEGADVRDPEVPGADSARIVVSEVDDQLLVTGFVQNGQLFEVVNVVDPAPYDKARIVRATEATLARLSAHADRQGAGDGPSTAAPETDPGD